jgi:hypothetical protein
MPALPHLMFSASERWMVGWLRTQVRFSRRIWRLFVYAAALIVPLLICGEILVGSSKHRAMVKHSQSDLRNIRSAAYFSRSHPPTSVPICGFLVAPLEQKLDTPRHLHCNSRVHIRGRRFESLAWMLDGPPDKVSQSATCAAPSFRDGFQQSVRAIAGVSSPMSQGGSR